MIFWGTYAMKRTSLWNAALIALPVISLITAGSAESVMCFDPGTGTTSYASYFALMEDVEFAVSLPLAAVLCGITLMLSSFRVVSKKEKLMKPIAVAAFAAMFCAVVPLLAKGERIVVPNMLVPIAMGITCLLSLMRSRGVKTPEVKKPGGPRLKP